MTTLPIIRIPKIPKNCKFFSILLCHTMTGRYTKFFCSVAEEKLGEMASRIVRVSGM